MRGPQCMTFYYHMYGDTMSCIVIYIKRQDSNKLKPLWIKSENRGDLWIRGQISINESSVYQVSHICIFICLFCLFLFFSFICFCESHLLLMRPINKIAELKLTIKWHISALPDRHRAGLTYWHL